MTTRLSSLQYNMLRVFATEGRTFRMSIKTAGQFDQRPFGSILHRGYITYGNTGFRITDEGIDAYRDFETHDILRRVASTTLSHYFQYHARRKTA